MKITGEPMRFETVAEWRAWLEANHDVEPAAWVVIAKRGSTKPAPSLTEATEEALCFGWIDSAMQPVDDEHYVLRYTPRRKGSAWSEVNKRRVASLIEDGRMTEAGLAAIEEAKRDGRWDGT
jgi:uncharacterized protein YdeI (YjbR/CyaY-like superfamily)